MSYLLAGAGGCPGGDCSPRAPSVFVQNTVQIGNQLPGLKLRSIVVGGEAEDKVSVQRGFQGCLQVQAAGARTLAAMASGQQQPGDSPLACSLPPCLWLPQRPTPTTPQSAFTLHLCGRSLALAACCPPWAGCVPGALPAPS